nr:MAG TPA: hypothetical protein [Caudoviricetes sp.]
MYMPNSAVTSNAFYSNLIQGYVSRCCCRINYITSVTNSFINLWLILKNSH